MRCRATIESPRAQKPRSCKRHTASTRYQYNGSRSNARNVAPRSDAAQAVCRCVYEICYFQQPALLYSMAACRISSVVSESVARAEPSASSGSSPRVTRHCRAGASPEHIRSMVNVWEHRPQQGKGFSRSKQTSPNRSRQHAHAVCAVSQHGKCCAPAAEPHKSQVQMRDAPEQDQVRLSVVRTGTATVRTGMLGRYLATRRAVEPPRVSTTIRLACTCTNQPVQCCQHESVMPSCQHMLTATAELFLLG